MKFGSWSLFATLNLLSNFQQNRLAGKIRNSVSFQDTSSTQCNQFLNFLRHDAKNSTDAAAARQQIIAVKRSISLPFEVAKS